MTFPQRDGCNNTTINFLNRAYDPPKWFNVYEWNLRKGDPKVYVNDFPYPVTIAIHCDDLSAQWDPFTFQVNMSPATPPGGHAPKRVEDESTPSNPDEWGGFSLGGTSGGPDEFGSPPGPSVIVDASVGRDLSQVPGRMGPDVQSLTLLRPIPVWNSYWSQVGLHLTVSAVHSPGDLVVSCPSTGYAGSIHVTAPGVYSVNLGTVPQTSQFSLTMSTSGGLDLEFDAIGVPSLVAPVVTVAPAPVPRVAALWNLGPTPTRGPVRLRFDMPRRGRVDVGIYDISGRRVATVLSGTFEAGRYDRIWSGHNDAGGAVPSGFYFCRLRTDGVSRAVRIVISR